MKNLKKYMIAALVAAGIGISGCSMSTDKFAGDWSSDSTPSVDAQEFFKNNASHNSIPGYCTAHIEKNGNSYLVTCKKYSYSVYQDKSYERKSGLKYLRERNLYNESFINPRLMVKADGTPVKPGDTDVVQEETGTIDYFMRLSKNTIANQNAASVENNGNTLDIKVNGWSILQCDYIARDDTLKVTGSSGNTYTLKRSKGSEVDKYIAYIKETLQKFITDRDNEAKEAAASGNAIKSFEYLSGKVEFKDDALNKQQFIVGY